MTPRAQGRPARELPRGRMRRWNGVRRLAGGAVALAARRPSRTLIALLLVSGIGAFAWNALMRQTGQHPHPLFARVDPPPEPPRRPDAPATPLPVPRPETASVSTPRPAAEPRMKVASAADPIGALIRNDGSPQPEAKGSEGKPAETKPNVRIVTAQKALAKLGYGPIEPDGRMGSTTRAALERFERDKKLPVTGSLAPKTSRQLAQLSGLSIE